MSAVLYIVIRKATLEAKIFIFLILVFFFWQLVRAVILIILTESLWVISSSGLSKLILFILSRMLTWLCRALKLILVISSLILNFLMNFLRIKSLPKLSSMCHNILNCSISAVMLIKQTLQESNKTDSVVFNIHSMFWQDF